MRLSARRFTGRLTWAVLPLVLAATALVGCGSANGSGGTQDVKVVYGIPTVDPSTAPWLSAADTGGFWKDEGLNVHVTGVESSGPALQLLASGKADIVFTGTPQLFQLRQQGAKIKAFASVYDRNHVYPVVRQDSPIRSVKQFKGKRLGIQATSGSVYLWMEALMQANGMSMDDFSKVIPVGTGATAAKALKDGKVDVLAEWHGQYALLQQSYGLKFRAFDQDPAIQKYSFVQAFFASDDTLKNKKDMIQKFLRGVTRGVLYAKTNPTAAAKGHFCLYPDTRPQGADPDKAVNDAAEIIATNDELSIESARKHEFGNATKTQVKDVETLLATNKLVKKKLPWTDYFDPSFIKGANDGDVAQIQKKAKNAEPQSC